MKKLVNLRHILTEAAVLAIGVCVLNMTVSRMNLRVNLKRKGEDSQTILKLAVREMDENAESLKENMDSFDASGNSRTKTIAWYLGAHPDQPDAAARLTEEWNLTAYDVIGADGTVEQSSGEAMAQYPEAMTKLIQDHEPVTLSGWRYYAAAIDGGGTLITARDFTAEQVQLDDLYSLDTSLGSVSAEPDMDITAVSLADGTITYAGEEALIGTDARAAGYDLDVLKDGYSGVTEAAGIRCLVTCRASHDMLLIATYPYADLKTLNRTTTRFILFLFAIVLFLVIAYAEFIRADLNAHPEKTDRTVRLGENLYLDTAELGRIRTIVLIGLITEVLLTFYGVTLGTLSRTDRQEEEQLTSLRTILNRDADETSAIKTEYAQDYTALAEHIAYLLKMDPSLVRHDNMRTLADLLNVKSLFVFDGSGRAVAMSEDYRTYTLSTDPANQSYPFWSVINGNAVSLVQEARYDDHGNYIQYIGVQRLDADGMVQIGVDSSRLASRIEATSLSARLQSVEISQSGFLFALDKESGQIKAYPNADLIGSPATSAGLDEAALKEGYSGFQTIDSRGYFVSSCQNGDDIILAAVPLSVVYATRLKEVAEVAAASLVILLVIAGSLLLRRHPAREAADGAGNDHPVLDRLAVEHGTNGWSTQTPEQKLVTLAEGLIAVIAMILLVYLSAGSGTNTILSYIMSRDWEPGVNLFSMTYCVLTMVMIIVLTTLIRQIIFYILSQFGNRSKTIGNLLNSFLKYAAAIGGIFYCLSALGLDAGTLLASAGILSLVIGLGAQRLISDILAGIFIVFEGSFRVGDIVTIDGWSGEVEEIGIRTTKIRNSGDDIRIFNNSDVTSVINMTKKYSFASVSVGIDYDEPLANVEKVLREQLPDVRGKYRAIIGGPYYRGVTQLGLSGYTLKIEAQCHESDRQQVMWDLNREVLNILSRNGISRHFRSKA